jgi:hypothetical protein
MMAGALQVSTLSGMSSTHVHPLKFGKMHSWSVKNTFKDILLNEVAMPFTFICVEIIITFFVKINKLVGINTIHPTTKDRTNHRFKLVIDFEMSML